MLLLFLTKETQAWGGGVSLLAVNCGTSGSVWSKQDKPFVLLSSVSLSVNFCSKWSEGWYLRLNLGFVHPREILSYCAVRSSSLLWASIIIDCLTNFPRLALNSLYSPGNSSICDPPASGSYIPGNACLSHKAQLLSLLFLLTGVLELTRLQASRMSETGVNNTCVENN